MGLSHIAAAKNSDADFPHTVRYLEFCFCNRLQNS